MNDDFFSKRFVRVGKTGFNPAHITDFHLYAQDPETKQPTGVKLWLNHATGDSESLSQNYLSFWDREAEAVRQYLIDNSVDLLPETDATSRPTNANVASEIPELAF